MEVDVLLDPFGASWPEMRAAALAAQDAGFGAVWTWDHLAGSVHGEGHVLECWTVLSALAAATERIKLGPCVLNVANRPAGTLAVMAATLQHISGGRLLLGIGAGGGHDTPYAAEQHALDRKVAGDIERRRAVEDTIRILREVWSGRRKGVAGFLRPDPPIPVIVAGFGPKMAALAGRVADGINIPAGAADLIVAARRARAAGATKLVITGSAGFNAAPLDSESPQLQRLEQAGFDRLVLTVGPPYPIEAIRSARLHREGQ